MRRTKESPVVLSYLKRYKDMDFFDNSNWFLTKSLLSLFGAWPFQSSRFLGIRRCAATFILCSLLVPEMLRMSAVWGNMSMFAGCCSMLTLHMMTMVNLINCFAFSETEKKLLMQIKAHRLAHVSDEESQLFQAHDGRSKKITYGYVFYVTFTTVLYMIAPTIPRILDYIAPLNETRPAIYLYEAEYFVDREEYNNWIMIHSILVTPVPATIIVAFDLLYYHLVEHACNLFSIGSKRMSKLPNYLDQQTGQEISANIDDTRDSFRKCIIQHVTALKFVGVLETVYTKALFFILGINMMSISIAGLQAVSKLDDPKEAIRLGIYTIALLIHLYFLSWPGQQLIDHSEYIHTAAYQGCWYNTPLHSQKLVMLTMMRSLNPCKLTAGGFYIMSLPNFCAVVKTSLSYLTMLVSLQ
ncbi:uncharacterized protein LOC135170462 isoform X2 [Diachasmimorpha longicaudata]|uniref:uncharacterized protein LOC135170462 isoform X2 n=1 Tax=Diachasmimorpha longicaudata TaxID=58733 RepID=UPI0030B8B1D7